MEVADIVGSVRAMVMRVAWWRLEFNHGGLGAATLVGSL
jgi:hypothetical protein